MILFNGFKNWNFHVFFPKELKVLIKWIRKKSVCININRYTHCSWLPYKIRFFANDHWKIFAGTVHQFYLFNPRVSFSFNLVQFFEKFTVFELNVATVWSHNIPGNIQQLLTHLMSLVFFYTLRKDQKTSGFLIFKGV